MARIRGPRAAALQGRASTIPDSGVRRGIPGQARMGVVIHTTSDED